ncbi:MAG: DNRLRE domain-containing protein, partial [Anaerolineae bacterium]|nr:DNRLRE domain-containing protein [Anaerolineae bacterium]
AGIVPAAKSLYVDLGALGYTQGDKPEGLALVDEDTLAVINDNDFGLVGTFDPATGLLDENPAPVPVVFGLIDLRSNGLDASDRDDAINIRNWPVLGMYMPDAIAAYEVDGALYLITANEGDARDEDERIKDLTLDSTAFPNAGWLQQDEAIGRLGVSSINGDIDNDGAYEQLWAYGARSFSVWDQYGNLAYDSSDDFEQTTADVVPDIFNSNGDVDSFDSRSDNKGPEPEGTDTGEINGRIYAFVGMERTGGIAVYDVTSPYSPIFASYTPQPADDLSPEGILFVPAAESSAATPLLIVTNEVSGTVTVYAVESTGPAVMRSRRYDVSMDTFINGTQPAANYGGAQTMWVGFYDQMRPLTMAQVPVCNDPLTCIPPDSAVDAAYLYLYVTEGRGFSTWSSSVVSISVHELDTQWQEQSATWSTPWTVPGGDFGPALDTAMVGSGRLETWVRFDVTDAVAGWLSGSPQRGFILTSNDNRGVRYGLATQENFDPSKTGYLRVMFHSYRQPVPEAAAGEALD